MGSDAFAYEVLHFCIDFKIEGKDSKVNKLKVYLLMLIQSLVFLLN